MVKEFGLKGFLIRRPDDNLLFLAYADTLEEAVAWCENAEREDEKVLSADFYEHFGEDFRYDGPFYEIIDIAKGKVVREGVY